MAPAWARLLWFVFVGWWLGLLWFVGSLLIMLTVILLPIGAYTMSKTWHVMTLKTSPQKVVVEAQEKR